MPIVRKALETLRRECQFKGARVLISCSGGADSVALLHFFYTHRSQLDITELGVYHLNHSLRGKEADSDQAFVTSLCKKWDITCYFDKQDVKTYAKKHRLSLEMAGRALRYQGLERIVKSESYDYVALGHTASDNAEWLLLNLIRGRAEPYLWGIPPKRDFYIRPFIRCSRNEIISYIQRNNLDYREDSSNESLSFDRNRIRHKIMPLLYELNPSVDEAFSRLLTLGDALKQNLDKEVETIFSKLSDSTSPHIELDTNKLSTYNLATQLRVLRKFAPWLGAHDLLELIPLRKASGTREISRFRDKRLLISYNKLTLLPLEEDTLWKPRRLVQKVNITELGWRIKVTYVNERVLFNECDRVFFDADILRPPFSIRPWKEGDVIIPYGHKRSRKIKKVFTNAKIPRHMRRKWPLVCAGDEVIWVVGLMRSAFAPISDETRKIVVLTLFRNFDEAKTSQEYVL